MANENELYVAFYVHIKSESVYITVHIYVNVCYAGVQTVYELFIANVRIYRQRYANGLPYNIHYTNILDHDCTVYQRDKPTFSYI